MISWAGPSLIITLFWFICGSKSRLAAIFLCGVSQSVSAHPRPTGYLGYRRIRKRDRSAGISWETPQDTSYYYYSLSPVGNFRGDSGIKRTRQYSRHACCKWCPYPYVRGPWLVCPPSLPNPPLVQVGFGVRVDSLSYDRPSVPSHSAWRSMCIWGGHVNFCDKLYQVQLNFFFTLSWIRIWNIKLTLNT